MEASYRVSAYHQPLITVSYTYRLTLVSDAVLIQIAETFLSVSEINYVVMCRRLVVKV